MIATVAAIGAIGAVQRFWDSLSVGAGLFCIGGPLTTLLLNIAGLGLMGCLAGTIVVGMILPQAWQGLFAIGLFGALINFPYFALDTGQLRQKQGVVMASAYVMPSVLLSLSAFVLGFLAVRQSGISQ